MVSLKHPFSRWRHDWIDRTYSKQTERMNRLMKAQSDFQNQQIKIAIRLKDNKEIKGKTQHGFVLSSLLLLEKNNALQIKGWRGTLYLFIRLFIYLNNKLLIYRSSCFLIHWAVCCVCVSELQRRSALNGVTIATCTAKPWACFEEWQSWTRVKFTGKVVSKPL